MLRSLTSPSQRCYHVLAVWPQDVSKMPPDAPRQMQSEPHRPKLAIGMLADVKALNIPRQRDVKLNELAKQILMLLPLLLLLLLLLYVLYHVLIRGREAPL